MSLIRRIATAGAIVACASLASCATEREPEFGSSVRHMVSGQTYNPAAPVAATSGVDGQKAAQAVETYRAGKDQDDTAGRPMVLLPTQQ